MKKILISCLLLLAACGNDRHGQNYNKHDTIGVIKEKADSLTFSEKADPVSLIRQQVAHINTTSLSKKHVEFMCDENTKVDYYYEDGNPVKISIDYGWIGDAHAKEDYYFSKGKLIFFYEFVEGGPACEGCIKTTEYRSYIDGDKVFKYFKNKGEEKCKRCEFGPLSKPYKLLITKPEEAKKVLCK